MRMHTGRGHIRVAVRTGKVSISKEDAVLVPGLTGNQSLSYHTRTGQYEIRPRNAEQSAAWKNDELYFDETPIREIAAVLARHYNADIQLTGPRAGRLPLYGQLQTTAFAAGTLLLANLTGITYRTDGKKIITNTQTCY